MSVVNIFGEIGVDFSAQDMLRFLEVNNEPTITVNIASGGGSAFQGLMIYDLLIQSKKTVHTKVVGLAGSAASIIFMSGKTREMTVGGMVMIHNSWANFSGNAEEVKKKLGTLEAIDQRMTAIFKSHTGLEDQKLKELLASETFIGVDEATELGFATGIADTESIAACIEIFNQKQNEEPVKMATEKETKEAGFLSHMMAYFKKDEPKAMDDEEEKEKAMDEEEKEKAMDEEEKEEPKTMDEEEEKSMDEDEEKAMDDEEEEKAMDDEEDVESLKSQIKALTEKLAEAEAKAQGDDVKKEEEEKAKAIFAAISQKKINMHEGENLLSKSFEDVSATLKEVSVNAKGTDKTEEPKEEANCSVYEEYQALTGDEKTSFFNKNKDAIINQMNTEK